MQIDELVRIHNNVAMWLRSGFLPVIAELVSDEVVKKTFSITGSSVGRDGLIASSLNELCHATLDGFLSIDVSESNLVLSSDELNHVLSGIRVPIELVHRKLFGQLRLPFDKEQRPEALCDSVGLIYDALEASVASLKGSVERASARSLSKQVGVDNPKVRARYAYCLISSHSTAKACLAEPVLRGTFSVGKVLAKDVFELLCDAEEKTAIKTLVDANKGYEVLKEGLRSKDEIIAAASSRESDLLSRISSLEKDAQSSSGLSVQNEALQTRIDELSAQLSSVQASNDYAVKFAELCLEEKRVREATSPTDSVVKPDVVVYSSPAFQARMTELRQYKSPNDDANFPVVVDRVLGLVKTIIKDNGVGALRSFRTLHKSGVFMYDSKSTALVFRTDFNGEITLCDVLTPDDRREWRKTSSGRFGAVKNGKESYDGERRLISSVADVYTTA